MLWDPNELNSPLILGALITGIFNSIAAYLNHQKLTSLHEQNTIIKVELNSRLTELLQATKEAAEARGALVERAKGEASAAAAGVVTARTYADSPTALDTNLTAHRIEDSIPAAAPAHHDEDKSKHK
jgi:hypothetical protein